jgi:ubiquinone/menaquinone biosynthesis C-methylase UbiE
MRSAMERVPAYRAFYEYEADTYAIDATHEVAWTHRRTLVHRLLPRDVGPAVLDVGCGDGALSRDLAAATGARVTALDLSLRRVLRAAGGAVRFAAGSSYELPFRDAAFSVVVCTDLLEHLDDPQRAMNELVRVSSRWVLISVPWKIQIEKTLCPHCGKDYFLYGHQHSFGTEGIERLAHAAGAEVQRTEHVIPMFECRRYKWLPPLKWLLWEHFKDSGTLGALLRRR